MPLYSSKFSFNDRSLSRLFYVKGASFIEYLQYLRILKCTELLSENNMNINMVAVSAGYESVTTLSNIFLHFAGLRPSDYIK